MNHSLPTRRDTPDKDAIALLPPFERLGLDRITLVSTGPLACDAHDALVAARAWGFDTESKPTFNSQRASVLGCFSSTNQNAAQWLQTC